jgi:hypothetical protein
VANGRPGVREGPADVPGRGAGSGVRQAVERQSTALVGNSARAGRCS